jgi:signal transduction protein with GAF and PtsI domain
LPALPRLLCMKPVPNAEGDKDLQLLLEIATGMDAVPLSKVLDRIVRFVSSAMKADSCFIYTLSGRELVLRASRNLHAGVVDQLRIPSGQGITGWVAEHRRSVAIDREAYLDTRFRSFNELPEDRYEAFLSLPIMCRGKLVGVMNVQHSHPYAHTRRDIQLLSIIGVFIGAEIELARMEEGIWKLSKDARAGKTVESAG